MKISRPARPETPPETHVPQLFPPAINIEDWALARRIHRSMLPQPIDDALVLPVRFS